MGKSNRRKRKTKKSTSIVGEKDPKGFYKKKKNLDSNLISLSSDNMESQADQVSDNFITSPREKALSNSVVLRTIMHHLRPCDLLRARLVSKLWKEEATIQLRLNPYCDVKFDWDDHRRKFIGNIGTLEDFIKSYLANSLTKFPSSQFSFEGLTMLMNVNHIPVDLSNFLSNHGQLIQRLNLVTYSLSNSVSTLIRKIIFEWTPNLKSFGLKYDDSDSIISIIDIPQGQSKPNESASVSVSSPSLNNKLNSLQEVQLGSSFAYQDLNTSPNFKRLISDILSSAPNLKLVSDPFLGFHEEIVAGGKLQQFHTLNFEGFGSNLGRYLAFSRARPQLKTLQCVGYYNSSFRTLPDHYLETLVSLIKSSRLTLKTLRLNCRLDWTANFTNFEIPVLEKLENLELACWSCFTDGRGRILPPGFSLQKSFPRLKSLRFEGMKNERQDDEDNSLDNPFMMDCNSSSTVEKLSIEPYPTSFCEPRWLSQAIVLYPNVRILHLDLKRSWHEVGDVCTDIWRSWSGSALEELHIKFYCFSSFFDTFSELVDQLLTGFDRETCRQLRTQRSSQICETRHSKLNPGIKVEDIQRGPSILNMTALKKFNMTANGFFPHFRLISRVGITYALEPMMERQNFKMVINGMELEEMRKVGCRRKPNR